MRAAAEESLALATTHGFPFWEAGATIIRGFALVRAGDADEGFPLVERGVAALHMTGTLLALPCYLTELAKELARHGRLADAERILAEAEAVADETGQHFWRPEILRLRGVLAASRGAAREGEASFREALAVASAQRAVLFELRAAVALATALRDRRRVADARAVLAPVVRKLREGLALSEVTAARALLRDLERGRRAGT